MTARAFITGLAGMAMSAEERAFAAEAAPWGLILFRRNIHSPSQIIDLVGEFRFSVGRPDAPVLVDQEGGRVQRLGPPHWPAYPPGATFGRLYDISRDDGLAAARAAARLIAADLDRLGINVDCLPLADVPAQGADPVIGDRAYGENAEKVAAIAAAVAQGLLDGGVLPVVKHIPGHGRATADSHLALPVVHADRATLERSDFAAFRPLAALPMAMTAHVLFTAIDPLLPATISAVMIAQVIRGWIGFEGLLMSDDISMAALSGTLADRARRALTAGCDVVLHCNGNFDEMRVLVDAVPVLTGAAAARAHRALACRVAPAQTDLAAERAILAAMAAKLAAAPAQPGAA